MHLFLITYKHDGDEFHQVVTAWDAKEAVEHFYESTTPSDRAISLAMFRKIIKSLSIGEAVAFYNSISYDPIITELYGGLTPIDLSNEFEENDESI